MRQEYEFNEANVEIGRYVKMEMWEILVPTIRRRTGVPYRTRYHRVWDRKVREITGGLTITPPVIGQWIYGSELFKERMIPVRIACTREQIDKIVDFTLEYYDQLAVMAYKICDEVIIRHADGKDD